MSITNTHPQEPGPGPSPGTPEVRVDLRIRLLVSKLLALTSGALLQGW